VLWALEGSADAEQKKCTTQGAFFLFGGWKDVSVGLGTCQWGLGTCRLGWGCIGGGGNVLGGGLPVSKTLKNKKMQRAYLVHPPLVLFCPPLPSVMSWLMWRLWWGCGGVMVLRTSA